MKLAHLLFLYLSIDLVYTTCNDQTSLTCGSQLETSCISDSGPSDRNWDFGEKTALVPVESEACAVETEDLVSLSPYINHNITKLGVILSTEGSYKLYLKSSFTAYANCVLSLSVGTYSRDQNSDLLCKVYHLKHLEEKQFRANFEDQCFLSLYSNEIYELKITSPQSESYRRIYRIFAPSTLYSDEYLLSASSSWFVLIGVNIHEDRITVFLQNLPTLSNRRLFLRLSYQRGSDIQLEEKDDKIVKPGTASIIFSSAGDLFYTLTLYNCPAVIGKKISESRCETVQSHTFNSREIQTQQQEEAVTEGMDTSGPGDDTVSVKETDSGVLQKQDLYILLGTIFGVIFLVLVIAIILLIYFKRRHGSHYGLTARFAGGNVYSDGMLLEEDIKGTAPTVLLLYSYDCQKHLACVQSLALLLQNALGCTVMADFWATQEIAERGIQAWLQHKMVTVNYVIVVCSTGARFKSVSTRRAQLEQDSDDAYIAAIRLLQSDTDTMGYQKMAVYFDYSSESDIPVLLENWQRYKLMHDIDSFIPTIADTFSLKHEQDLCKNDHQKIYSSTLQEKITAAKIYMAENPDWFHENLQALMPAAPSQRSTIDTHCSSHNLAPSHGSQQLELVTVEHNRTLTDSEREETTDLDMTDSPSPEPIRNPRKRHEKSRTSPLAVKKHNYLSSPTAQPKVKVESGISSLDSYSSSLEDLEHDINFILNPSLPSKTLFMSMPQGLVDILPQLPIQSQQLQTLSYDDGVILSPYAHNTSSLTGYDGVYVDANSKDQLVHSNSIMATSSEVC